MLRIQTLVQPRHGKIVDLLHAGLENQKYSKLEAAVAYVTVGGVSALRGNGIHDAHLDRMRTQWLAGVDWYRSDPVALEALSQRANSNVRVFDGSGVTASPGCAPVTPFHPKGFVFSGQGALLMISGSANLSRNGLTRGVELNTVIEVADPRSSAERSAWDAIQRTRKWFATAWRDADIYGAIATDYSAAWQAARPVPPTTDDHTARPLAAARGFSSSELAAIRRATTFWIQSGNLTHNLGPGMPGNQLMMRALTRVFFGFSEVVVPKQTPIGSVEISFNNVVTPDLSLEFAHNGMDRLNLPRPSAGGPSSYDQQTLVFRKRPIAGQVGYALQLASKSQALKLLRQSDAEGLTFAMPGQGRAFGFSVA